MAANLIAQKLYPLGPGDTRRSKWPFSSMAIGRSHEFSQTVYPFAACAAKNVEYRKGYKFNFLWDEDTKTGMIERIS